MSVSQETGRAMVRVEQAEKMLYQIMNLCESLEHELARARGALRGKKTESIRLPGKQSSERPANVDAAVHMVLADAALSTGETDLD